jgi:hypothetical protein
MKEASYGVIMRLLFNLALLILAAAPPALAQAPEPPSRVGQISHVSGNLGFHAAGDTQWSAAGVNYPVATGGSFWTDPQARAQIQIGPTTIGMAGGTELDVTNLNDQVSQFSLPQGRINLHLRQLDNGQSFEVDLPQGAVWLLQPGSYDIDAATADQPARVAVFAGSARFVGGGADIGVNRGDAAVLTGANPVVARIEHAAPDAFVEWCAARDYHAEGLAAARYVSPQMTGYADLDHYGGWQGNPQYGEVWYPSQVPADWAPYRDGRWIWVQPWGWTWVDQQPWGFAPFHYGRWAYMDDRWGWVPGSYVAQPVYAPALVAFVGAVAGIGLAAGGGPAVGWFPLAPGETYWPSYTHNVYYIRNVNITNVKNINNIVVQSNGTPPSQVANANFANRRFATVVPQRVFANADPVAPAAIHVSPAALEKAPVVLHPPQVKPSTPSSSTAVQGPQHPRPVPVGPGLAPPARPAGAVSTAPAGQPHLPGTQPEHAATPVRPGTAPNIASIPPHPGVVNPPERSARPPATVGAAATSASEALEHGVPHPAAAPNTAALPPSHALGLPPAREARPVIAAPVHPPAAASIRREAPLHPAAPPEPRPAAVNEAHPVAPHPAPPAQAFHPPVPAVARLAPAVAHPPAPPPHLQPPAQAFHPPAPAVGRPVPAVAHPPTPPPRPRPAPAPPAAHGGGKPAPKEKGKEGDNRP